MKIQQKTNILLLFSFFFIILVIGGYEFLFENTYSKDDFYKLLETKIDTILKDKIKANPDIEEGLVRHTEEDFPN